MSYDDEDDDIYGGYESDDDLDDVDAADDGSDVTIACPYCGEEMYDDAEQCPHCGQYLSDEDRPSQNKPAWIIVVILLCIAMMLLGLIVGF